MYPVNITFASSFVLEKILCLLLSKAQPLWCWPLDSGCSGQLPEFREPDDCEGEWKFLFTLEEEHKFAIAETTYVYKFMHSHNLTNVSTPWLISAYLTGMSLIETAFHTSSHIPSIKPNGNLCSCEMKRQNCSSSSSNSSQTCRWHHRYYIHVLYLLCVNHVRCWCCSCQ